MQTVPSITGYTPVSSNDCPRCGALVRVLYVRNDERHVESPRTHDGVFHEERFRGGLLLVENGHRAAAGGYSVSYPTQFGQAASFLEYPTYSTYAPKYRACGLVLPEMQSERVEPLVQELADRLVSTKRSPEKIISFDTERFLAAPWFFWAPAREPGQPPIALMPAKSIFPHVVVRGMPELKAPVPALTPFERAGVLPRYLDLIGAVTEPRV